MNISNAINDYPDSGMDVGWRVNVKFQCWNVVLQICSLPNIEALDRDVTLQQAYTLHFGSD